MIRGVMRCFLILAVSLAVSLECYAKDRAWQDADVEAMDSNVSNAGTAIMPVGAGIVGVPLRRAVTYYRLATPTIIYIVETVNRRKPLNLTLHGKTKIYIDGQKMHILDDGGKDVTVPIVEKMATQALP
jgi:hypothetical protein